MDFEWRRQRRHTSNAQKAFAILAIMLPFLVEWRRKMEEGRETLSDVGGSDLLL
jgi:hypothetical protein